MKYKYFIPLLILALAGLAVGAFGLVDRLQHGLNPTALGSYIPWGLWVAFYLLFLGLSAGAFLVTIMTYVLGMKQFEHIGPLSAFVVLVALICEVQFILLDLGQWHRALYQFFLTPSFTSLLTWMFILFNAMLVIYALKTFFLIRGDLVRWSKDPEKGGLRGLYGLLAFGKTEYTSTDREKDMHKVHILAKISLPVGLIFYGTNGAFFAVLLSRPVWNSAMTPLLFVVAALLSGGALIAFLTYIFRQKDPLNPDGLCYEDRICLDLGKVILFLLVVFLALEGMQFFVGYQTATIAVVTSLDLIVKGPHWWVFWIVHILIGSLIPMLLLIFRAGDVKSVALACFLIFITFAAVRYNFVIPDLAVYKLEGLEATFAHPRLRTDYVPNLNEWLVSLWIISTGLVVMLLGTRFLPIVTENGGTDHA
ncbi:MAG: polysulfide reductase NrfD [Desulfomicrobium sp.]|nr:polysulfide reductase NrfD [Pseudomonadota bacterium]MBV1713790.1 polysulfide reductase NrfD [Desulfomicrobium sp.]MBU4572325.1 polysulfide reductase NrfD [Pseudomonadota bacterium]MBU4594303.1 polysulfide reductase NrfD [Pseudomonadota bacterium]MBV1719472.1 polysulfide reductase NrfD [Desulfomicrobium sp.]